MAMEIVMPRLSDTMEQGTIARWLKQEGEEVHKGEPLAEIETDKATMTLESYGTGKLLRILLPEGQTVPIGTPIAILGSSNEAPTEVVGAPSTEAAIATRPAAPPIERPVPGLPPVSEVKASPIARRLAEELNIDLSTVTGTGPGGRITREDVESVARARRGAPPPAAAEPMAGPIEQPATRMQQTIAWRMVQSKTTIPHFYVTTEVDVSEASRLRQQLNTTWTDVRVGFTDLIVKAVGLALRRFPLVNASWQGDHVEYHEDVNIGLVVSVEGGGLLVPVLHQVDRTDLYTLAKQAKALVQRTREGKALPGDYNGGTFTISNLGHYPVEAFLAIINPPESGILAVGQIEKKPVVKDDQVVISPRMHVSLSADHRVYYGITAAEFLGEVKKLLEHPLSLLT
jgi:pyruvate dehydrogenase E2 component (dihydrolipoamide acetyltransferase)